MRMNIVIISYHYLHLTIEIKNKTLNNNIVRKPKINIYLDYIISTDLHHYNTQNEYILKLLPYKAINIRHKNY